NRTVRMAYGHTYGTYVQRTYRKPSSCPWKPPYVYGVDPYLPVPYTRIRPYTEPF
ncbi:hypothetical protein B0H10DRAFT_2082349, partial [Mycena sp. CBHHK59/15]